MGGKRGRCRTGERYQPPAMIAQDRYGDESVMVWGGITMTGRTELHICQRNVTGLFYYTEHVVEPIVVPNTHRHGNALVFQNDDARSHRAHVVQNHLQFRKVATLPGPAKSPDMSPTERLWDILRRRVRRQPHKPQDINELADAVQKEWRRILQAITGRVIKSMRRRCLACLAANEGPTRY